MLATLIRLHVEIVSLRFYFSQFSLPHSLSVYGTEMLNLCTYKYLQLSDSNWNQKWTWFAGNREHLYVSSSSLYGFHKYTKISFILNATNIQTLAHTPWSVNEINSWNLPTVLIGLYFMISHTCIHIPHFDTYHIAYKSNISPCKHFPHVAMAAHRSIVFGLKLEN